MLDHLKRLSKSVIRNCYGCKKLGSRPYHSPKPGPLPKGRTEKCFAFEVIGTDYMSFKRLISRRGKPKTVYSDNAKTFKAGAKWLANIKKDQKLHDFLSSETIIWKFNAPKAPWWGDKFEQLIGLS